MLMLRMRELSTGALRSVRELEIPLCEFACVFRESVSGTRPSGAPALLIHTSSTGTQPLAQDHYILRTHTHTNTYTNTQTMQGSFHSRNFSLLEGSIVSPSLPCERQEKTAPSYQRDLMRFQGFFRGSVEVKLHLCAQSRQSTSRRTSFTSRPGRGGGGQWSNELQVAVKGKPRNN